MNQNLKLLVANIIVLSLVISSCQKQTNEPTSDKNKIPVSLSKQPLEPGFALNDMVMYWNEKVAVVLGMHTNPGNDSRSFAMIEIAVHDALNSIKPKYQCYALLNERMQFANPDAAVASAAYWAIKGLNVQKTFPVDEWYDESLATIPEGNAKELGKVLGRKSADAIIANRSNDGLNQVILRSLFPLDGDEPGEYRSTLPVSNPDLNLPHYRGVPNWSLVMKPFVLESNYQFRPPGPYAVNSQEYTVDYNEVKSKGALVGSTRTEEEEQLARFWSQVTHHLLWNNFVRKIVVTKKMDAWKTARLFALVHTAMADGANSMFDAAYYFYFWRPETAIRIEDDGNPTTVSDPTWLPGIISSPQPNPIMNYYTPQIPEYASGGVFGGVTGQVLHSFFGTDEISIDMTSLTSPGVTIHYSSISKAVSDNSISRIFAGWSFRKSAIDGIVQGKKIGEYVYNNHFREVEN